MRGGESATPAKVADVCLRTDEECLMRKDWDTDKFTQGGGGKKKNLLMKSMHVHYWKIFAAFQVTASVNDRQSYYHIAA